MWLSWLKQSQTLKKDATITNSQKGCNASMEQLSLLLRKLEDVAVDALLM